MLAHAYQLNIPRVPDGVTAQFSAFKHRSGVAPDLPTHVLAMLSALHNTIHAVRSLLSLL